MTCDIPLKPIPDNILSIDNCSIEPPQFLTGGDALNVAIGSSTLGLSVKIVGRIGRDMAADIVLNQLCNAAVLTDSVVTDQNHPTAMSFVLIDENNERHFASSRDIFGALSSKDIKDEDIAWADYVYFGSAMQLKQMDFGGIEDLFSKARQMGKVTVMDAAYNPDDFNWGELLAGAFKKTDYFLPSEIEVQAITGSKDVAEQIEFFSKFSLKGLVIKQGEKGAVVTDFEKIRVLPAVRDLEVVDTNGAGDSFVSGFIRGLSKGWSLTECARFAGIVAAKNIGAIGATGGVPTFSQALEYHNIIYPEEKLV